MYIHVFIYTSLCLFVSVCVCTYASISYVFFVARSKYLNMVPASNNIMLFLFKLFLFKCAMYM